MENFNVLDHVETLASGLRKHRDRIAKTLEYADGTHTFDDVCLSVMQGKCRFWDLGESFLITEIIDFPQMRVYHIWLAGGDLADLIAMHPEVQQVARDAGCTRLTINGRSGWLRALKAHGWRDTFVALAKDI